MKKLGERKTRGRKNERSYCSFVYNLSVKGRNEIKIKIVRMSHILKHFEKQGVKIEYMCHVEHFLELERRVNFQREKNYYLKLLFYFIQ